MSSAAEKLKALTRSDGNPILGYKITTVVSLGVSQGTVVVSDDEGDTTQVMGCLSTYSPVAGHVVVAHQYRAGWVVVGALGQPLPSAPVTTATVTAMINAALAKRPQIKVITGSGSPSGAGWVQGAGSDPVWVRDDGLGAATVYVNTGTVNPPAPTPAPDDDDVDPVDQGGWRVSGSQTDDHMKAGSSTGNPPDWFGGLFYGTRYTAAVAGKTVDTVKIRFSRQDSTHGNNSPVVVKIATHTRSTIGRPTLGNRRVTSLKLARGGTGTVTLNATEKAVLAAGGGIGVYGYGQDNYQIFDASGHLDITYT